MHPKTTRTKDFLKHYTVRHRRSRVQLPEKLHYAAKGLVHFAIPLLHQSALLSLQHRQAGDGVSGN